MALGDILELKFQCRASQQIGLNVRHYRVITVTPPEPTHQDIANALSTIFGPLYVAALSANASYVGASVRKISPLPLSIETFSGLGAGVGAVAGDILPKQTAGVVTIRSALAGRANRGRAYLPFPSEADNTLLGVPGAGYTASSGALATAFAADRTITVGVGNVTLRPVIWRRVPRTTVDVITALARTVWGTQRRRGDFGRINPPPI